MLFNNIVSCRKLCTKTSLIGKYFIDPEDLSTAEIKSLLWTVLELKTLCNKNFLNKEVLKPIRYKRIIFIAKRDELQYLSLIAATNLLGTHLTKIVAPKWDSATELKDIGKFLEVNSDLIFCQTNKYMRIRKMAENISVPVVSVFNARHAIPITLADAITIYELYGKLKDVNVAWIGHPCPLMCSQLCIFTRLGMNINYCNTGEPQSPIVLKEVKETKHPTGVKLKEFTDCGLAVEGADIIVMRNLEKGYKLRKKFLAKAHANWFILEHFPRISGEIDKTYDDRNLIWECTNNLKFVFAAIILRFLKNVSHVTCRPNF